MTDRQQHRRGPDFFVVGAAKAGTTSLDRYLAAHPEIFMCPKELHQFGSDLTYGSMWRALSRDEYLQTFAGAGKAKRLGDTSPGYLYSTRAAAEIRSYRPDAQIIIMLRNPIEALQAFHANLLYVGHEDIEDLEEALAAEPDRRAGRRIPSKNDAFIWALFYRDVVRYPAQVRRYLETFERDRVHVIIYDDFKADTAREYRRTLEFLGVDPAFQPAFTVANPARRARVRSLSAWYARRDLAPPWPWRLGRRVAHLALPSAKARGEFLRRLMRANTVQAPRPALRPELRERLRADLAEEVAELGELLARDLSHWVEPARGGSSSDGAQVEPGTPSS